MNNVGSGNVARLGGCRTILSKGIIIIVLSPVENVIRTFFRRKFAPIPDHSLTKLAGIDDGSVRGAITILFNGYPVSRNSWKMGTKFRERKIW